MKEGVLRKLKEVLDIGAAIAVCAGLPFFFLQQCSEERNTKVASALQFVTIYNNQDLNALQAKVTQPWLNADVQGFLQGSPSHAAREKLKRDVFSSSGVSRYDIVRLVDFYNSVASCGARDVCDDITIKSNFCEPIVGFYRLYDFYLAGLPASLNKPHYLDELQGFVAACKKFQTV